MADGNTINPGRVGTSYKIGHGKPDSVSTTVEKGLNPSTGGVREGTVADAHLARRAATVTTPSTGRAGINPFGAPPANPFGANPAQRAATDILSALPENVNPSLEADPSRAGHVDSIVRNLLS